MGAASRRRFHCEVSESLARQCGARAGAHRRPAVGAGADRRRFGKPGQVAEAVTRIGWLHREQPGIHSELWRAVPEWRAYLDRFCGIDSEPRGEQAHGEKAANGLDGARSPSAAANADAGVEWRTGRDIPPLVPAVPARTASGTAGSCLSAPVFSGLIVCCSVAVAHVAAPAVKIAA